MTFRVRTALVVLAVTALTMGGAFTVVWERFVTSQRVQLDRALREFAHGEAADLRSGRVEFSDTHGPHANGVELRKYGVLFAANGDVLGKTANFEVPPARPEVLPSGEGFDFEHEGQRLRGVLVSVEDSDRNVLLAVPREDLEDDARILAHAMAIAFAVGCAWVSLVAFVVASRLTREHRLVASVARAVAGGDTSARVDLPRRHADLRQLATDLNAMIDRLVGLLAMQERFIAHAAHELRTPLTSLHVELAHAKRSATTADDYREAVEGALQSIRRLTGLADGLLQLARAARPPNGECTFVRDALGDALATVEPLGRERAVTFALTAADTRVLGARGDLARLFRNLLENALRFAADGTSVRVAVTEHDEAVRVDVVDDGPGIDPDDAERIFEPFGRGKQAPDAEGSGLGLAIARSIARAVRGDVRAIASSTGGHFVVTLRADRT